MSVGSWGVIFQEHATMDGRVEKDIKSAGTAEISMSTFLVLAPERYLTEGLKEESGICED